MIENAQDIVSTVGNTAVSENNNVVDIEAGKLRLNLKKSENEEKEEIIKSSLYEIYMKNSSYYRIRENNEKRLTNFIVTVLDCIENKTEDNTMEKTFTLQLTVENRNKKTIIAKNNEIIDSKSFNKKIRENLDTALVSITEDDFGKLRAYIFSKSNYVTKHGVDFHGIIKIKENLYYVDDKGAISYNGVNIGEYLSIQTQIPRTLDIKEVKDINKDELLYILSRIFKISDPKVIVLMFAHALYSTYSGVAKHLFQNGNADYKNICMFIEGLPSSGKTTLASLIYSICLISDFELFSKKATDTRLSWDNMIKSFNTMPLVLNEVNPRDLSQWQQKEILDYIKNAYDWLGKSKGDIKNHYQTTTQVAVNAPIVTIGQQKLIEDGLNYRGMRVYIDKSYKNDNNYSILKDLEKNRGLLYKFGKSFKLFNLKTDLESFNTEYMEFIDNIRAKYRYDDRHCRTIATALQAYRQLERFLESYGFGLEATIGYKYDDIYTLVLDAFKEFTLDGGIIDKPVEVRYLEYINKAAELSDEKTINDIKHIAFQRDFDFKVNKHDGVQCLAIASSALNNANALIREYISINGLSDNELISLESFLKAMEHSKYVFKRSVSVKMKPNSKKCILFSYDELVKNGINIDFMLDRVDAENVASDNNIRTAEEQAKYWRELCEDLQRENNKIKQELSILKDAPSF